MDKKVIFAVAGSGKTTYIVDSLSLDKHSLIVTYTTGNFENLANKILTRFDKGWPENITLMTYFQFLYHFCYRPFLSDIVKDNGITFISPPSKKGIGQDSCDYYLTSNRHLYSNRVALLLEKKNVITNITNRIQKYFDEFIVDEVQDIAGRDFTFLEKLMRTNVNMLFVGDYYQHTYDTSRDGNVNKNLFKSQSKYEQRFSKQGFIIDKNSLVKSWRCSRSICSFVTNNLGIPIESHRRENNDTEISFLSDPERIAGIVNNQNIVKLHYKNASNYGDNHRNWGATKGEDHYQDVCVLLNKTTATKFTSEKLHDLPPSTRNKLYVAITRARGNVYLINEDAIK